MINKGIWKNLVGVVLLFLLSSCATYPKGPQWQSSLVYTAAGDEQLLHHYAPVFVAEKAEYDFNKIGTPVALMKQDQEIVRINPAEGAIYTAVQDFSTKSGTYTNLLYRVHFSEVPFRIVPFYLGAGRNVGLLAVVTLNEKKQPVLYTLVHTCGCYLAFVPTSYLSEKSWKRGWKKGRQIVYGENLPRYLQFSGTQSQRLIIHLRSGTHRVKNVWLMAENELAGYPLVRLQLYPFEALERLSLSDGTTTSFYETSGARQGYVKDSRKIWERLLISWWALDWRVGEDKKLGRDLRDGIVFYTSLKPWAREESDMRDFSEFLRYWGWKL